MLVVIGANGRTGCEIVAQARALDIAVRPVVRDDRDSHRLNRLVDVGEICYADADHPDSLPPVLQGATSVVSCIDPRTAGHAAPVYTKHAAANILRAAVQCQVDKILHMTVVGAYRWSPNPLNRQAFQIDRQVRILKHLPWTMVQVSCYLDELIDAHVAPPDDLRPHRVPPQSRYSPISRQDVARFIFRVLAEFHPRRKHYLGGAEVIAGPDLMDRIHDHVIKAPGFRKLRLTTYGPLPPGDVSVHPETTLVTTGKAATDTLEMALASLDGTPMPDMDAGPAQEAEPTVYPKAPPGPHPADQGAENKALREMGTDLRRVVHARLVRDLPRLGHPDTNVQLDFSKARKKAGGRTDQIHEGVMKELTGVAVIDENGKQLHKGAIDFLHDALADEFFCWWAGSGIPVWVWDELDMGVRRRLEKNKHFATDPRVKAFDGGHEVVET